MGKFPKNPTHRPPPLPGMVVEIMGAFIERALFTFLLSGESDISGST